MRMDEVGCRVSLDGSNAEELGVWAVGRMTRAQVEQLRNALTDWLTPQLFVRDGNNHACMWATDADTPVNGHLRRVRIPAGYSIVRMMSASCPHGLEFGPSGITIQGCCGRSTL